MKINRVTAVVCPHERAEIERRREPKREAADKHRGMGRRAGARVDPLKNARQQSYVHYHRR